MLYLLVVVLWLFVVLNATVIRSVNNELGRMWKEAVMAKFVISLRKEAWWHSWLRHCSTSQAAAGSILD